MKVFQVLRIAGHLTLNDAQKQSGVNVAIISMFENGLLALTDEQKSALHRLFPNRNMKELFSDLDLDTVRSHNHSIFRPRKLSPQKHASVDAEVKKSMKRIDEGIKEKREKLIAIAKESVEKFNQRGF